ncbi:methionine--tRNA ligase [Planctomycetota bacterium]
MGKYVVTSALPYINGMKHLGNMIGSLLPADVFTRYLRMKGEDVIYICGTDDHGTPAELGAIEEKMPIRDYVKKYYQKQQEVYERFGIKFDYFGQTSSINNHRITQHLFLQLHKRGLIEERTTQQMFCVDDDRFLPDRFIRGTCPKCGYDKARGDQCENCSTLLNPEELVEPYSSISGSKQMEMRSSRHLYLRLTALEEQIGKWLSTKDNWPNTVLGIARKWLQEGLQERCITRDLKWGVKVPLEGWENKVFYVWFDAPIGYIGITMDWAESKGDPELWKTYWKDPSTKLVQFMGKDNVPFHAVTWPATLMGAEDGFILADFIKGFEWLQYEGGKFSTSERRGVFSDQALEVFPADYWRFYLIYNAPERSDSNFNWQEFGKLINSCLANSLGNFAQRCLTMVNKRMGGELPAEFTCGKDDQKIIDELHAVVDEFTKLMDGLKMAKAIRRLHSFWIACNQYIDTREPWREFKTDPAAAANTLALCMHLIRAAAILALPVIPAAAQEIFTQLGLEENVEEMNIKDALDVKIMLGRKINSDPHPIFARLDDDQIQACIDRFSGGESDTGSA